MFISANGCGSESDPHTELQLTHEAVRFEACNQPAAAAINANVRIGINGMIEHIEEFRLELRVNPLGDGEVFEDGHVGQELSWPSEAVALNVSELANARIAEWTALSYDRRAGGRIIAHCGHRSEVDDLVGLTVKASGPH